jgi:hypothetical protein
MTAEDRSSGVLERARLQRAGLRHAIGTVEATLAAPAGVTGCPPGSPMSAPRLAGCSALRCPHRDHRAPRRPPRRDRAADPATRPRMRSPAARARRTPGTSWRAGRVAWRGPLVPDSQWSAVVVSNVRHEALPAQLRSRPWMVLEISSRTRTDRLSPRCRGRQRERRDGFVGIAESLDVWPRMRPRRTASLRWPSIAS